MNFVMDWLQERNNHAIGRAAQAYNDLRGHAKLLEAMCNARSQRSTKQASDALDLIAQVGQANQQFTQYQESETTTVTIREFTATLQKLAEELAQHIAAGAPQFLRDASAILDATMGVTQRRYREGWGSVLHATVAGEPLWAVFDLKHKVSRGGQLTHADLESLCKVVDVANKTRAAAETLAQGLKARRAIIYQLASQSDKLDQKAEWTAAALIKAQATSLNLWASTQMGLEDTQRWLSGSIHTLLTRLHGYAQPGQTDWTAFDNEAQVVKDHLALGHKIYDSVLNAVKEQEAAIDQLCCDIHAAVRRIKRLQARFDGSSRDLNEARYWAKKLLFVMQRFNRFAHLPGSKWPAPKKARRALDSLLAMVDHVEQASKGNLQARTEAAQQLPQQIVFTTRDVGFFFHRGAPLKV